MIAVAATGLTAGAFAQSNVTIYGSMDAGVAYINNIGGNSAVRLDQGTMQPDRIGFRGVEDLGGGLKANFQLETGFFVDTGAMTNAGRLFNRASTVGLSGNFGAVTLGNMPDIVFDYAGKLSNGFQLTNFYLFHPGNLDTLANTYQFNNAIRYTSPTFSGLTVSGMVGLGEVAGDSGRGRNVSAGANYVQGPLRLALAYSKQNDRPAGFAGTFLGSLGLGNGGTVFDSLTTIAAGAGYAIGNVRMHALYTQSKIELPTISPTQKNVDIGTSWRYTPANALNVGYSHSRLEGARYNQISVGNAYSLSKRTEIYAQAAYQRAGGTARFAIQNNTGVSSSDSQLVTTVGVHHSF
ncbi:porin [Noviherbaspirillum saxi]|uniref:Porin n=1 Tax=Noviherbaspirillum saxi TaxID=2320863 RepID=A0A3A3FK99_9BURK|nr:porin [Noviherbaspirillum saxi]